MEKKLKVVSIVGTRPEMIKMAPVLLQLKKQNSFAESFLIATGQHRDMLAQMLDTFSLKTDFDLNIMEVKQTLTTIVVKTLQGLEEIFGKISPDVVLVHGDTSTSFAGALSAYYAKIPIAHVEAGLRTYDKYNPYPEEVNRRLIDAITDIHFAPTDKAAKQLMRENISSKSIFITGNTVIDALKYIVEQDTLLPLVQDLIATAKKQNLANGKMLLVETHRRENWGEPMQNVCTALKELVEMHKDIYVIFPVHPNPVVKNVVYNVLAKTQRVYLLPPQDYLPFVSLMKNSFIILTDSGGIQEEASSLGKPVLVLRTKTERPEAVAANTALLVGTNKKKIVETVSQLLENKAFYKKMSTAHNPYGDGKAAERTVDGLLYYFGLITQKPQDFNPKL